MMRLDEQAIDAICKNKHICIDMSDVDKELLPNEDAVFLLFRNVDINSQFVDLDFSNCTYQQKAKWLETYATTSSKVEIKELVAAWSEILRAMLSQQLDDVHCTILSACELRTFVKDNIELCTKVAQLLHDAMHWAALEFSNCGNQYVATSADTLSPNILFCGKSISSFDFKLEAAFKTCKSWPTLFVPENIQIIKDMFQLSKCCVLLYGKNTPQWNEFQRLMLLAKQLH